ncbi:MAG: hypothetical protein LBC27_09150 [Spirochaetaceae bacterium]|nr:hypothetical protein [Spirochaetaceae bacterium]
MGLEGYLSQLYKQYKAGAMTMRKFEACIFKHILDSRGNDYGLYFKCRSERIDFLCWFYPRMHGIVERYEQGYSSFDAYVASTIRYSYRSYKERKRRRSASENACWNASNMDMEVCYPEKIYEDEEELYNKYTVKSPKHILLVLLKSYYYVSDRLVNKVASALDMSPEVLGRMIDTLHGLQLEKIERLNKLVSATHCLYYRCLSYERQLANQIENPQYHDLLLKRLERSRQRLSNMRERLKSIRIEATNSDLAKVLGVPKGTIDSRMAVIKNKLSANNLNF